MGLKAVLKALDGLSDDQRALYRETEVNGTKAFVLDLEGLDDEFAAEHFGKVVAPKLVSALNHERGDRRAAKEKLKLYAEMGEPDEIQQVLQERQKSAAEKAKGEGNWEERERQLIELHNKENRKLSDANGALSTRLDELTVDVSIDSAIELEGGKKALLRLPVRQAVKRLEEDGKTVIRVVDEKGNVRIGDAQGTPMTVRQFVASLRETEEFAPAFDVQVKAGIGSAAGSERPSGKKTPSVRSLKDFKNDAEKSLFIKEHGLDAYKALPKE